MDKASATVLNGFVLRKDDAHIYRASDPYYDSRGYEAYETVSKLLGDVMNHPGHRV